MLKSLRPTLRAEPLLERQDELAQLDAHFAKVVEASTGRFIFIGGEAGVGKTSVVRSFCARQSIRVLTGSCDALTTPHPFAPVLDVAAVTNGALRATLLGGARPYEVAAALLDELRFQHPTVLVLEDLHWADDATMDVIRLLARRVEAAPALVIATFRDDQLDRSHPLRVLIGELSTAPAVVRVNLMPLSPRAVAELAGPYDCDAAELYRRTGGNPFFVTEVLEAGGEFVPRTVQDAVLARVARLGPVARRFVETTAIFPAGIRIDLLEALDAEAEAVTSVDECLASGVLVALPGGVAFRHELARLTVEMSLSPARRVALHRAALAALRDPDQGPPDLSLLSHHAEAAGDTDAVLRFAPEAAASAAAVGSHREAAAHYARALRFSEQLPGERRAELLSVLSWESYLTGDFEAAIETRRAAIDVYRDLGDRLREGDALRAMSANLRCHGLVSEAAEAGVAAVEMLEELVPGPELALAYANRAMLALNVEDSAATRFWGGKALELSQNIGDRETLVHAMNSLGTAGYLLGDDKGRLALERSVELCKDWGFIEQVGRGYIHLAWASVRIHDYARAATYQREGIEYCIEHGLDAWRFEILGHQARRLLDQGQLKTATDATSTILTSVTTNAVARTMALAIVALLRARRGDPDARTALDEAWEIARPTGELQHLLPVATASAEIAWLEGGVGNARGVQAATEEALSLAQQRGAASAVSELAAWRRRCAIRDPRPSIAVGPYALELAGDPAAAAAAWLQLGCDYEAGVALCTGSTEADRRRALTIFHALDARPAAALAARLLRESGVRAVPRGPRPSTTRNGGRLTTREVEVLGLLGQAMRNRDIARRLHLSEKTVDHHVAAILAKLGVSSRAEAVTAAARFGIVASSE